jgi:hypothetical protein
VTKSSKSPKRPDCRDVADDFPGPIAPHGGAGRTVSCFFAGFSDPLLQILNHELAASQTGTKVLAPERAPFGRAPIETQFGIARRPHAFDRPDAIAATGTSVPGRRPTHQIRRETQSRQRFSVPALTSEAVRKADLPCPVTTTKSSSEIGDISTDPVATV